MNKKKVGLQAENLASKFLENKDYKILDTNWTCHWGELDIIAEKNNELVFIEVKYRKSNLYGYPHESFTKRKRISLIRAIYKYLSRNNLKSSKWRLDLITIIEKPEFKLEHYKSVEV